MASEIETKSIELGVSPGAAGLLGGMGGGIAQAYTTMGSSVHSLPLALLLLTWIAFPR